MAALLPAIGSQWRVAGQLTQTTVAGPRTAGAPWGGVRGWGGQADTPIGQLIDGRVRVARVWTHRRDVLAVAEALVGGEEPTVAARLVGRRLLEVGGDAAAVGARGAGQAARRRAGALGG